MTNNEIPVKVIVKTTIDDQETMELVVFGSYIQKGQVGYLKYEEVMEEGEVRTIVKLSEDEILILRGGAVNMRLPFQRNKRMIGHYELPFAVFETTTWVKSMEFSFENGSGLVDILYDFFLDGDHTGTYHMNITFHKRNPII
nr:DUF1934 family protein [Neobacillus endophyticus]